MYAKSSRADLGQVLEEGGALAEFALHGSKLSLQHVTLLAQPLPLGDLEVQFVQLQLVRILSLREGCVHVHRCMFARGTWRVDQESWV